MRSWLNDVPTQPSSIVAYCNDKEVARVTTSELEQNCQFSIAQAKLWDIGAGNLYKLDLILENADGQPCDRYQVPFGVRVVSSDTTGIYLNGRQLWLTGFGKHEDFPGFGRAPNPSIIAKDMDLLKWCNGNSYRTSHYPYDEDWYDYADRHGILIIDETPFVSLAERLFDDELEAKACRVIEEMVVRDWNHPSVILWSVANEPFLRSDRGTAFFKAMGDTVRKLDSTRPVGYVAHEEPEFNKAAQHFDWIGVNKYFGWYEGTGEIDGTIDIFKNLLTSFHEAYNIPILLSEFGADATQGENHVVPLIFTEHFQNEIVEKQIRAAATLPFICGCHVWNFADFATGQQLNRAFNNRKGAFSRDRSPKQLAFTLRRMFALSREEILALPPAQPQVAADMVGFLSHQEMREEALSPSRLDFFRHGLPFFVLRHRKKGGQACDSGI